MNQPLPSTGFTDPWPEILHLLAQKITYKGQPIAGTPEQIKGFANWLMQQMPAVVTGGDPETKANCFLAWLRSEQRYETDTETRMRQQAAVAQPPPNPISSQTVPQQAQVMAPPQPQPVAAASAAPAAEPAETGPGIKCPECGTDVSGVRGFKRHVTMTHKVDWPAFCTKHGLDQKTGTPGAAPPQPVAPAQPAAPPPPPQAQPVPPMFQSQGPAAPFVAPAPPPPPASMPTPPATVQGAPSVPTMGVAPPPQPIPSHGPMVAFNPAAPAAAPPVVQSGLPGQQQIPFAPPQAPVPVMPQMQAPAMMQPQAAPALASTAPTREDLAKMLGGPVDLIVVRLLDAATVNLQGRVDVNQIAAVAEAKAKSEMKVVDLAQASYGAGKQAAQRHFAELLTAAPGCYLLLNGYEPILPAGYLEILAARVTKFHIVTDSGRQTTTIF